jgi:chromosomal replication initiation ATPase DnaA
VANKKIMTTEKLITNIADAAKCTPEEITGKSRTIHIANARAVLQHALRQHDWTYARIAQVFATDHSSVIKNVRRVVKAIELAKIHFAINNVDKQQQGGNMNL